MLASTGSVGRPAASIRAMSHSGSDAVLEPSRTTGDVLVGRQGELGLIRLNRPRAINALTTPMVRAITEALQDLAAAAGVSSVLLDGAGERGLCAGGDVVAIRTALLAGSRDGIDFFRAEYAMNAAIAASPVPVIAWMDGVVMGGGVGISVHARLRLVTERTRLAMPETIIGYFPDVGSLWWLARCPAQTGTRLALTGATITGADAVALGLADRLVPTPELSTLRDRAAGGEDLSQVGVGRDGVQSGWLAAAETLAPLFAGDDPGVILDALRTSDHPAAIQAADDIAGRSPFAVSLTLAALRRAERMDTVGQVLAQDLALAEQVGNHPDFVEGVRAQLVDKDRTARWQHRSLAEVDRAEIDRLFG